MGKHIAPKFGTQHITPYGQLTYVVIKLKYLE